MGWKDEYKRKKVTADKAVKVVNSGNGIGFPLLTSEPPMLMDALYKRKDELKDVVFFKGAEYLGAKFLEPGMEKHFRLNSSFVFKPSFQAVAEGRADFTSVHNYAASKFFENRVRSIDIFMGVVSPPDRHGNFSLGINVFQSPAMIAAAKTVIFEVNEYMPRTYGASNVNISKVDLIVENSAPLVKAPKRSNPTEVEKKIGENVASLIKDGDTIQIGMGSISEAIVAYLADRKDLGMHSELLPAGMEKLVANGVVTGKKKTLHPGKILCTYCLPAEGDDEILEFVKENPMVEFHTTAYVNNPCVIAQNDNMVAIVNALEIDLFGQANAETFGPVQYSGIGGFCDFVRGANMSKGGRAIIVLPSTAKNDTISRIVSHFKPGTVVSSPRSDTDIVVTEYGIARLAGRTNRDRARALISVAHPKFRESIMEEAKKIGLHI
jgi:4-hydroxybutyrate CoA-transferase